MADDTLQIGQNGTIAIGQRIKRNYDKMMVVVSLECLTPTSGFSQILKGGVFSPDRKVTPTVIAPTVQAGASDIDPKATMTVGLVDATGAYITDAKQAWKIDGVALGKSAWVEGTDYDLKENGKNLWIKKNLPSNNSVSISCSVLVTDSRTGAIVAMESEPVNLQTTESAPAPVVLGIGRNALNYDRTIDRLNEWNYREAHGIEQVYAKADAMKAGCYLKTVDLCLTQGANSAFTTGYGLKVTDSAGKTVATLSANGNVTIPQDEVRVTALSLSAITFDCRTIDSETFTIQGLDKNGAVINTAKGNISIKSFYQNITLPRHRNVADYTAKDTVYKQSLTAGVGGEELPYPEVCLDINYYVAPPAHLEQSDEVYVGSGNSCTFDPNKIGSGVTPETNGFDNPIYINYQATPAVLTDEDGNALTDENGETIIG